MSDANPPSGDIRSYILRLWAEDEPTGRIWRVSLTPIPDGERVGFADLQAAFEFLQGEVSERPGEQASKPVVSHALSKAEGAAEPSANEQGSGIREA